MINILFYGKLIVLIAVLTSSTVTDLKKGIVRNWIVFPAILIGLIADIWIWILVPEGIRFYLLNILIAIGVSLFLYGAHVWAGGDCKLMIAAAFLVPFELYPEWFSGYFCLSAVYIWIFSFSFIYLVIDSIRNMYCKRIRIDRAVFFRSLVSQGINWLFFYPVVFLFLQIFEAISSYIGDMNKWTAAVSSFLLILILSRLYFLKKWYIALLSLILGIVVNRLAGLPFVPAWAALTIPVTFAAMALRLFIETFNYETIPTQSVSTGMILSESTVALFAGSGVKGLPTMMTEDLRARLTPSEAESVRRWGKTKKGLDTVCIMRKMPFVIFIFLGLLFYLLIGVYTNDYSFF